MASSTTLQPQQGDYQHPHYHTQQHQQRQRPRPTPAAAIADTWRSNSGSAQTTSQLDTSPQYGQRGAGTPPGYSRGQPGPRSHRPPSGLSTSTTNPSRDSLLSLDQQQPHSPATTVDAYPNIYSRSSHSLHPSSSYRHSQPHPAPPPSPSSAAHPPSRSHHSLPPPHLHPHHPHAHHHHHQQPSNLRHHAQLNRVYPPEKRQPAYDADFDRSLGSGGAGRAADSAAAAGPSRGLFNPNGPALPPPVPVAAEREAPRGKSRERSSRREREREKEGEQRGEDGGPSRRPQRSKREPVDPNDLGRRAGGAAGGEKNKDSRESLAESIETDFSGRTKSSSGGAGRRRRRGREGEDEEGAGEDGGAGGKGKSRQLFDPRRDDPMRFTNAAASSSSLNLPGTLGAKKHLPPSSDVRSLASFASGASDALDSSTVTAGTGGADDAASVLTRDSATSAARKEQHPAVATLRKAYREITDLEGRLQEEHRAAMREREREVEEGEGAKGVRIQGQGKRWDDEYWVKLANGHKQLADAHYSFLQLALDPRLPAALNQLPQRYSIPTRLWQVAFHQLLERMRHAVLSAPVSSSSSSAASSADAGANVLEHLIEFIQYAYTHYSQLFEDPIVATFRAAWIEQLGDLARYRMAVAGLASRVHAAQAAAAGQPAALTSSALDGLEGAAKKPRPADAASIGQAALNDWDLEEQDTWREMARDWYAQGVAENPGTGRLQHHLALLSKGDELRALYHYVKSLTAAHPYLSARESILPLFEDEHQARRTQPDVTKAELFVHLHGMLFTKISLDDFDDVLERFLERLKEEGWHLGKQHDPEETLGSGAQAPFGDREWFMLGVINIAALLQYGAEDGVLKKLMARDDDAGEGGPSRHGGGGGKHGSRGSDRHLSSRHGSSAAAAQKTRTPAPQAIMVKRAEQQQTEESATATGDETERPLHEDDVLKPLNAATSASSSPADDPLPFKLAQRLAFSLLSFIARDQNPFRRVGGSTVVNPYVTLLLTFLSHLSSHPAAFKHVERTVPWDDLTRLLDLVPEGVNIRVADAPNKLVGGRPLPEDWCIRGMDWAGRQLFGRGYWRDAASARGGAASGLPPPIEGVDTPSVRVESEMDALKFDLKVLLSGGNGSASPSASPPASALGRIDDDEPSEHDHDHGPSHGAEPYLSPAAAALAESRWRRVALSAAWLVRNVPGLDYDPYGVPRSVGGSGRFTIREPLRGKMERWAEEDRMEKEAERLAKLSLSERNGGGYLVEEEAEEEEEESEDEDDPEDSEAVKELKARRRALKTVLRQARQASRAAAPSGRRAGLHAKLGGKAASLPKVFAGYTVLVFDTNILLTSLKLFRELVEAECWTIIVPLAVITELDGLKRNQTALGVAAVEMVDYLEYAIRTYARYLKIQTSRGNYLKDLAIRNESIDFGSSPAAGSADSSAFSPYDDPTSAALASHDHAHTMDDVILRAASWQAQHFTSRLALVHPRAVRAGLKVPPETAPVVLVTFDRNLRLKARARGLEAIDEKGLRRAIEASPTTALARAAVGTAG